MMVDAGQLLSDAGTAMHDSAQAMDASPLVVEVDAAPGDAAADAAPAPALDAGQPDSEQPLPPRSRVLTAACDHTYVTETPYGPATLLRTTMFYALVDVGDPLAVHTTAWACDYDVGNARPAAFHCGSADVCDEPEGPRPEVDCLQTTTYARGSELVVPCGSTSEQIVEGEVTVFDQHYRWHTVRVIVD